MEERSNIIGSTVLSVESDIKNIEEIESVLKKYCVTYSSISRTLFNTIVNASEPQKLCNGLQREYIKKYDIQARVFKSVWKHVCGKIQSIKSNQKNYDVLREKKIEKLEKKLADYIVNNANNLKKKSVKRIEFEDPFNPENIDMFKDVVFDTNNTNDTKNIKNKKCKKTTTKTATSKIKIPISRLS